MNILNPKRGNSIFTHLYASGGQVGLRKYSKKRNGLSSRENELHNERLFHVEHIRSSIKQKNHVRNLAKHVSVLDSVFLSSESEKRKITELCHCRPSFFLLFHLLHLFRKSKEKTKRNASAAQKENTCCGVYPTQ